MHETVKEVSGIKKISPTDRKLIIVNTVLGTKSTEGYEYIPEIGISIQGQDANGAWKAIRHIASNAQIPIDIEFVWRDKEGAAYPGTKGRLSIK